MLKWIFINGNENVENVLVYESATEAGRQAEHDWNTMTEHDKKHTTKFFVGLANMDGNDYAELEDGTIDADIRVITKQWSVEGVEETSQSDRIKNLTVATGLSLRALAQKYGIPYRSVQHWSMSEREMPSYVLEMLERLVWSDLL